MVSKTNKKFDVNVKLFSGFWTFCWLFTVGFLQLGFWKGLLAVFIWAYYLGRYFSPFTFIGS